MSANSSLAQIFESMADLLELTGANPFRVSAHRRVARVLESLAEDAKAIVERDPAELTAIDGIGDGSAKKIVEFIKTGKVKELDELRAEVPPGLPDLLRIQGLGPKTIHALWKDAGIVDIPGLKAALDSGKLEGIPRLGPKSIANLKESLEFLERAGDRKRLGEAMPVAEAIVAALSKLPGVEQTAFAGSLRRGRETIGDLDILVAANNPAPIAKYFQTMGRGARESGGAKSGSSESGSGETKSGRSKSGKDGARGESGAGDDESNADLPEVIKILASGDTRSSVRLSNGLQADLRVLPPSAFGAALLYFTGSKEHNVRLRERAISQNRHLNEYGLFPDDGKPAPQDRGVEPIVARTEEEIYAKLGLPWIAPELREDRGEANGDIPNDLISIDDIRSELHAHTNASDGSLSLSELIRSAKDRGFHTIAVTDHSRSSVQANGLDVDRLRRHIDAIRDAGEKIGGIQVLAGSEVDIHPDGHLDYEDEILALLDIVVASPHASLKQDPAKATERLLAAVRHPLVDILGHPTGRIINGRPGLEPDMSKVIAAAKECSTALEVNAHWMRLDLRDVHVRAAADAGVFIAIDCDVHSREDFDNLRYGVMTARRGWLTRPLCINAWDANRLREWLTAKRAGKTKSPTLPARSRKAR